MTLTEFLLARIAEDEEPTYELVPYGCGAWCCAPPGWVGHRCLICDAPAEFGGTVEAITEISREHEEGTHGRSRTLAECKAKREIVTYLEALHVEKGRDAETHARWLSVRWVAERMAKVYADHPDYRAEWREA